MSFIFIFSFFTISTARTQSPDCPSNECYDNNNVNWITGNTIYYPSIMSYPNCNIKIYYRYRYDLNSCPSGDVELQVDYMIIDGN